MNETFTPDELMLLRLGLETIRDRLPGTEHAATAIRLIERIKQAEEQIRSHGAVAAGF